MPITNSILNSKKTKCFTPKINNKTRISAFTISNQCDKTSNPSFKHNSIQIEKEEKK